MSTALYRRYRPEAFADVIGQEHVTEPLMAAIEKGRVNHAYLFSGPRGCGKTTSARILARCLNCAQGPTPVPCGVCDSCVELARGGSGSLDVIEIDAASHGGVDDARDLRERATFAPVRDRYKIFIIDEAHMVTSAGFNALLKIVEEPPEHIKFIFATTEPDKVIGTIRSRTHHYPFRLVPPEPLMAYLDLLCQQEGTPVAPGVLSLVIRAGGGSVRDSLSVLDQLMAGAGPGGLDYELAVSLLGYTHASLLDDVVDAFAAGDAATVFSAVDRVIQTGHDPRRFVEDLLERFRDLIIVNAVPDSAAAILRGTPDDQLNRMRTQANQMGRGELSRAADITNTALTEMTGATSPRLHLELLCARILLPAADETERGTLARVDRIERRLQYAGSLAVPDQPAGPATDVGKPRPASNAPDSPPTPPAASPAPEKKASSDTAWPEEAAPAEEPAPVSTPAPETPAPDAPAGPSPEQARPEPEAASAPSGAPQVEMIRRAWPEIMDELAHIKRTTWLNVNPDAKPRTMNGNQLVLAFATQGNAIAFQRGTHMDNVKQAIHKILALDVTIDVLHDGSASAGEPNPKVPTSRRAPTEPTSGSAPEIGQPRPPLPPTPSPALPAHAQAAAQPQPAPAPAEPGSTAPAPTAASAPTAPERSASPAATAPTEPRAAEQPAGASPTRWNTGPGASGAQGSRPRPAATAAPAAARNGASSSAPRSSVAERNTAQRSAAAATPDDSWASVEPPSDEFDPGPESNAWETAEPTSPERTSSARPASQITAPETIQASEGPAVAEGRSVTPSPAAAVPAARPLSRYQRLLDEAERKRLEEEAANPRKGAVDLPYVEDEPSADDETIEESGLVGRSAIERILNGKLIEERGVDSP